MDDLYLDALKRWMTPADLDTLRKGLGSADDIVGRTKRIEQIIEKAERREAIWQFLKMVGLAFVTIMGAAATLKAVLPSGWWP